MHCCIYSFLLIILIQLLFNATVVNAFIPFDPFVDPFDLQPPISVSAHDAAFIVEMGCVYGPLALAYNGYGCFCGADSEVRGGSVPIDGIDACCQEHDKCWHKTRGKFPKGDDGNAGDVANVLLYRCWTRLSFSLPPWDNYILCNTVRMSPAMYEFCECDRLFISCLKKYSYPSIWGYKCTKDKKPQSLMSSQQKSQQKTAAAAAAGVTAVTAAVLRKMSWVACKFNAEPLLGTAKGESSDKIGAAALEMAKKRAADEGEELYSSGGMKEELIPYQIVSSAKIRLPVFNGNGTMHFEQVVDADEKLLDYFNARRAKNGLKPWDKTMLPFANQKRLLSKHAYCMRDDDLSKKANGTTTKQYKLIGLAYKPGIIPLLEKLNQLEGDDKSKQQNAEGLINKIKAIEISGDKPSSVRLFGIILDTAPNGGAPMFFTISG